MFTSESRKVLNFLEKISAKTKKEREPKSQRTYLCRDCQEVVLGLGVGVADNNNTGSLTDDRVCVGLVPPHVVKQASRPISTARTTVVGLGGTGADGTTRRGGAEVQFVWRGGRASHGRGRRRRFERREETGGVGA